METIEIIVSAMSYEQRAQLIDTLAQYVQEERANSDYYRTKFNELRDATSVDVSKYEDRIGALQRQLDASQFAHAALMREMSELRQSTIKAQCALGIINHCQEYSKAMLDALFADTPDYKAAWNNAPYQLTDAVLSIDPAEKIERIKLIRQWLPGLGPKQAKDFVEMHWQYDKKYGRTSE